MALTGSSTGATVVNAQANPLRASARVARGVSSGRSALMVNAFNVATVPTKPIEGQKTGTSGLRKKTNVFMGENYLANWVQCLFNALGEEAKGTTMVRTAPSP